MCMCAYVCLPPSLLGAAEDGSDEEMADAQGTDDEDGKEDELLREWSKRLVK